MSTLSNRLFLIIALSLACATIAATRDGVQAAPMGCSVVSGSSPVLHHPATGRIIRGFGASRNAITRTLTFHGGVDYLLAPGEPVVSAGSGRVIERGYRAAMDGFIRVDHGNGYETLYAHLDEMTLARSDCVKAGQVLGRSDGHHPASGGQRLHVELYIEGTAVDPLLRFLQPRSVDPAKP